jgi:hypothetical protein
MVEYTFSGVRGVLVISTVPLSPLPGQMGSHNIPHFVAAPHLSMMVNLSVFDPSCITGHRIGYRK